MDGMKKVETGLILVSKMYKEGKVIAQEDGVEETINVRTMEETEVATVSYNSRMTLNLGNFESVQIGVSCTLPTYVEEMSEAFETAKRFVENRIGKEVGAIREYRKAKLERK